MGGIFYLNLCQQIVKVLVIKLEAAKGASLPGKTVVCHK